VFHIGGTGGVTQLFVACFAGQLKDMTSQDHIQGVSSTEDLTDLDIRSATLIS